MRPLRLPLVAALCGAAGCVGPDALEPAAMFLPLDDGSVQAMVAHSASQDAGAQFAAAVRSYCGGDYIFVADAVCPARPANGRDIESSQALCSSAVIKCRNPEAS